jgi:hypothetical protein
LQKKTESATPRAVEKIDEITITTTPANALVYINDKYIGKTPYSYQNAPYGKISVRVKASGFDAHTWNINYYGGKLALNKKF